MEGPFGVSPPKQPETPTATARRMSSRTIKVCFFIVSLVVFGYVVFGYVVFLIMLLLVNYL
jgi:hypothetical protein